MITDTYQDETCRTVARLKCDVAIQQGAASQLWRVPNAKLVPDTKVRSGCEAVCDARLTAGQVPIDGGLELLIARERKCS